MVPLLKGGFFVSLGVADPSNFKNIHTPPLPTERVAGRTTPTVGDDQFARPNQL